MVMRGTSVPPSWLRVMLGVDAVGLLAEELDLAGAVHVGDER